MPHKHNDARRRHIPKMSFKVENWPEYEAGLRRRGSLTLWIEDGALVDWQTRGKGGQARYTEAAIQTSLMLRAAFKLPLRQTEGLMASVIGLMGLTISAPDHTTVSRRAVTLPDIPLRAPPGPLHVLIDVPACRFMGRANGSKPSMARNLAANGASCTWPSMPAVAGSWYRFLRIRMAMIRPRSAPRSGGSLAGLSG